MSGRQAHSLTSWLMMVPLLVVPIIAVFGVPKLDLLYSANADGEEPELELEQAQNIPFDDALPPMPSERMNLETSRSSNPRATNEQPTNTSWTNPFDDPEALSTSASSERGNPTAEFIDPFTAHRERDSSQLVAETDTQSIDRGDPFATRDPGYTRSANDANRQDSRSNPDNAPQRAPVSQWKEAVNRLNQLGVQKYQLSQTEEPFVFSFACDLTHPDSPRITHRFQAEAGEPLQAVTKVIQQVETWSAQINNR